MLLISRDGNSWAGLWQRINSEEPCTALHMDELQEDVRDRHESIKDVCVYIYIYEENDLITRHVSYHAKGRLK